MYDNVWSSYRPYIVFGHLIDADLMRIDDNVEHLICGLFIVYHEVIMYMKAAVEYLYPGFIN